MDYFIDFFPSKEEKLEAKFLPCKEVFSKEAQELLIFSEAEKYVFFKLHNKEMFCYFLLNVHKLRSLVHTIFHHTGTIL